MVLVVQGLAGAASSLRMVRRGKYGHSELKSIAEVSQIRGGCAGAQALGENQRTGAMVLAWLRMSCDSGF